MTDLAGGSSLPTTLLETRNLTVSIPTSRGWIRLVRNISLDIFPGETLALVGETGSGKSTVAHSILGLLNGHRQIESGEILYRGRSILERGAERERIRGRGIGMVFQDARGSLNPVLTIGAHLMEAVRAGSALSRSAAYSRAIELLDEVRIPAPESHMRRYPSEISGGMCQRVGVALGICNNPGLLIADEPTSALDPTIQLQILDLLKSMQERHGLALLLITHDLALVSNVADRVAVMYHGTIVETGTTREIFLNTSHPYTQALIGSMPKFEEHQKRVYLASIPGSPPAQGQEFPGCPFAPRCPRAEARCAEAPPPMVSVSSSHTAACIFAG